MCIRDRYTLYFLPWNNSNVPGLSSHPAKILPIIHTFAPAAIAFVISPEYLSLIHILLPRWTAYCVSCGTEWLCHPTPSSHRLRRGLPGYLILFAHHAFAPQRPSSSCLLYTSLTVAFPVTNIVNFICFSPFLVFVPLFS